MSNEIQKCAEMLAEILLLRTVCATNILLGVLQKLYQVTFPQIFNCIPTNINPNQ